MSEEAREQQEVAEKSQPAASEQQEVQLTNKQVRESPLFKKTAAKVSELTERLEAFEAQFSQQQREQEVAAAAEQGKLKEELERVLAERESYQQTVEQKYAAKMVEADVKLAAAMAGVRPDAVDFVLFKYGRLEEKPDDVNAWLAEMSQSETDAHLFREATQATQPIGAPPASPAAGRSGTGSADLQERLKRFDPDAIKEATARVLAGKKPY